MKSIPYVPIPKILGFFAASFTVLTILLNIIVLFIPFDNPAMGLIIVFVASNAVATYWFKQEQSVPANTRLWNVAVLSGFISAVVSTMLAVFSLSRDQQLWREFNQAGLLIILGAFVAILIVHIIIIRLSFWFTFRKKSKKKLTS